MTQKGIVDLVNANVGKWMQFTFEDGVVEQLVIGCGFHGEGFLCSGPDGRDSNDFWVRIETVSFLSPVRLNHQRNVGRQP